MILGLDISTSITGYTVIDDNGNVVANDGWEFKNKKYFPDMFSKADHIKVELIALNDRFGIDKIFIEPALSMFQAGKSSALTISTLIKFNGIVSYLCYEILGITPEYIPAVSARKICGITVPKGSKAKQVVMKFLIDNEPTFKVELTPSGNPKPKFFDMADSIVIARAGHIKCSKIK